MSWRDIIAKVEPNPSEYNFTTYMKYVALTYMIERAKGGKKIQIIYRGRKFNDLDLFKRTLLQDICTLFYKYENLKELFDRARLLMDKAKEALKALGYEVIDTVAETKTKLLIGISEETFSKPIFEVGLMWDPYLNLPYIPGSSLKGAFRAYLELRGIRIAEQDVDKILGSPKDGVSCIMFLDSYPIGCRSTLLIPEVTTPIYSEIEGKIQETYAQPVPVIYPAINTGVRFRIIVGINKRIEDKIGTVDINRLKGELLRFISETLREGIGAKTMLGYGQLTVV